MHICVDARMWQSSGIGTYLQNILPALTDHFDITLIGAEDDLDSLDAVIVHNTTSIYTVSELLRFPFLIPRCDVFWSPHYNVPVLPIRTRKRLVTIHDVFHLAYYHTLSWKQKVYASLIFRVAARLSNAIITVSTFSKQEIVRFLPVSSSKIGVICNGINHQLFYPIQDQALREKVKQKHQLPARFILFVGNVKPHKNLMMLVQAFAQLASEEMHLVIVGKKDGFVTGDASLFNYLQQDESLNKRVHFTGFVAEEDLPVIYNLATLFVFPSLYEGFGLPPLEAMACGCPVLVSDQASVPEVCGEAAQYMNPYSVADMREALQRALTLSPTDKQLLINRGLEQVKRFQWTETVAQHVRLMQNLVQA